MRIRKKKHNDNNNKNTVSKALIQKRLIFHRAGGETIKIDVLGDVITRAKSEK